MFKQPKWQLYTYKAQWHWQFFSFFLQCNTMTKGINHYTTDIYVWYDMWTPINRLTNYARVDTKTYTVQSGDVGLMFSDVGTMYSLSGARQIYQYHTS